MNCIMNSFELFKTNTCQATVIAVVAFLAGMVVMCLACKLFGKPCGKACDTRKSAARTQKNGEERPFEKRKPHPAPADGSVEIYVGNLSYEMTEDELRKVFEAYGKVNLVRIVTNRYNGKSKGFGFIHMPVRTEAEEAIRNLNDRDVGGRTIKCNEAKNVA